MKKQFFLSFWVVSSIVLFFPLSGFSVSMNYTGQVRSQGVYYSKLGQDLPGTAPTKQFLETRFLLEPNLVIDDHFSIKSQWNLLSSPNLTPSSTNSLASGQGGYILGDPNVSTINLSRAWLEWTSDFGVLRVGRMPVSWGYGLLYDAGNGLWDNWQTTLDRLEYRLHLGHVIGALAYSKPRKLSVEGNVNDSEYYTVYLQYDNPEMDVEGGLLYEKQARASGQSADLMGTSATPANHLKLPAAYPAGNVYPLSSNTPYPKSNNVLDVYLKKTFGYFSLGGEASWLTGEAFDYNGNSIKDDLNAFGLMANVAYEYHKVKLFTEFVYASGDASLEDHLRGFVLLHRNRSPGFIFGRELLGPYSANGVGLGTPVAYGNSGSYSGVYYFRPGFRIDWSPAWASGLEVVIAKKTVVQTGEESHLALEFDLGTDYSVYKNFDLGMTLGLLFPGKGITPDPKTVFGFRTTASLKF